MKRPSFILMAALLGVTFFVTAAEREGLPPGLQKKDKLPPGWQKKQKQGGRSESPETVTNAVVVTNAAPAATSVTTVPVAVPPPPSASVPPASPSSSPAPSKPTPGVAGVSTRPLTREQQDNLARMERVLGEFETQARRPGATEKLLQRLSRRHDIPLATLQGHLQANPSLTVPQLYLAAIVSRESRSPLERILTERKVGTSWADIIRGHKLHYSDVTEKLRSLENVAEDAANQEQTKPRRTIK